MATRHLGAQATRSFLEVCLETVLFASCFKTSFKKHFKDSVCVRARVRMHPCQVPVETNRKSEFPRSIVTGECKPPAAGTAALHMNSKYVSLTGEPRLQPPVFVVETGSGIVLAS